MKLLEMIIKYRLVRHTYSDCKHGSGKISEHLRMNEIIIIITNLKDIVPNMRFDHLFKFRNKYIINYQTYQGINILYQRIIF